MLRSIELPTRHVHGARVHVCACVVFPFFHLQDPQSARWLKRTSLNESQRQSLDDWLVGNPADLFVDEEAITFAIMPSPEFKAKCESRDSGYSSNEVADMGKTFGLYVQQGHIRGFPLFKQYQSTAVDAVNTTEMWCSGLPTDRTSISEGGCA